MFNLIENGNGIRVEYASNGLLAFELRGSNSPTIAMTYANLVKQSLQRADDYISGIMAGLLFCQLSGRIPGVTRE